MRSSLRKDLNTCSWSRGRVDWLQVRGIDTYPEGTGAGQDVMSATPLGSPSPPTHLSRHSSFSPAAAAAAIAKKVQLTCCKKGCNLVQEMGKKDGPRKDRISAENCFC